MTLLASVSPTPVPFNRRLLGPETLEGREHGTLAVRRNARPGVGDGEPDTTGRRRITVYAHEPAATVVLDRIGYEVRDRLAEALAVGVHMRSPDGRHVDGDVELLGLRLHEHRYLAHDFVERDGFERKVQLPGVDARHVEDLVYQLEQVTACPAYVAQALVLSRGEVVELEELRETEDRIQRCAQLVAHARQELALGAVRLVELPFECDLLAHVGRDRDRRHDLQVVVEHDLAVGLDHDCLSIGVPHPEAGAVGHHLSA